MPSDHPQLRDNWPQMRRLAKRRPACIGRSTPAGTSTGSPSHSHSSGCCNCSTRASIRAALAALAALSAALVAVAALAAHGRSLCCVPLLPAPGQGRPPACPCTGIDLGQCECLIFQDATPCFYILRLRIHRLAALRFAGALLNRYGCDDDGDGWAMGATYSALLFSPLLSSCLLILTYY